MRQVLRVCIALLVIGCGGGSPSGVPTQPANSTPPITTAPPETASIPPTALPSQSATADKEQRYAHSQHLAHHGTSEVLVVPTAEWNSIDSMIGAVSAMNSSKLSAGATTVIARVCTDMPCGRSTR